MLVRVETTELSALARTLRILDGGFARVATAASPVFTAGHPSEAISLLSFLRGSSSWALDWADNLDWRVDLVRAADLVALGRVPSFSIPGPPGEIVEFVVGEDVAKESWEADFAAWRMTNAREAFLRRLEVGRASRRLVEAYMSVRDREDLVAFVESLEHLSGEIDLLAAFFGRLGSEETARIAYLVLSETHRMDRNEAAGIMAVFAGALAAVVRERRVGEDFIREFIDYDGWTLAQFLIHAQFDQEFVIDATRAMLSLDGRINHRGPLYHYGWESIGESEESFRPQRVALMALAANPGAALRVMGELYQTEWGPDGLDGVWSDEFALALESALAHDDALRTNRLALSAIVNTGETGRVSDRTALVLVDVYERHLDAFAAAAELELRGPDAHAWSGGVTIPKETAWRFLAVLFDHDVAVGPIQDATAPYLARRAFEGVLGDGLDWAGDVGALTQLVYDAHAASVLGEAQRNDATEAFLHGLLNKAVAVVTLPGGPATKFAKSVLVDQLFRSMDDDYAGVALDEIAGMRHAQLEFETYLLANAYHEAGLTNPDLIAGAVARAEQRYPGRSADFVDSAGHLMQIDDLDQAQLAALAEWVNGQEELWREAATEIARAARAMTVVTQDSNVRTP